ncbi:MAG: asparagine synthetase B [Candidatus Bathyarchaeota archaeon]|jgi:asparagine synthase (glutamine-hydrolysing)|nr:asparagine synthetase B [Candidatus Bathyarchaeota archaeon]
MGTIVAVIDKKGEDATNAAVTMLKSLSAKTEICKLATPAVTRIEKSLESLESESMNSSILIGQILCTTRSDTVTKCVQPETSFIFEGQVYSETKASCDTLITKERRDEKKAAEFMKQADGDFAFIFATSDRLVAGRAPIGVCPLYYGENAFFAALASERKALWKIGVKETASFPPGHVASVSREGFCFKPVKTLACQPKMKTTHLRMAAMALQALLQKSVCERVKDLKEVAVAFSGGLDSSVVAWLAKNSKVAVFLMHVSLRKQPETQYAKQAAEALGLSLNVHEYSEEDLERVLPDVLWAIETADPLAVSIGIPMYWAAEKAVSMDCEVVLAGQGADELFGGYKRYVDCYIRHGSRETQRMITNDILRLHETNIERDRKICDTHGVELRLPFAAYNVARFALDLPLKLKIEPRTLTRKFILKKTAANMGLPQMIVEKPKKAMQYATGTTAALKKMAQKKGTPLKDYLLEIFQKIFEREDKTCTKQQ